MPILRNINQNLSSSEKVFGPEDNFSLLPDLYELERILNRTKICTLIMFGIERFHCIVILTYMLLCFFSGLIGWDQSSVDVDEGAGTVTVQITRSRVTSCEASIK